MTVNARVSLFLESAEGVNTFSKPYNATVEGDLSAPGCTVRIPEIATADVQALRATVTRVAFVSYDGQSAAVQGISAAVEFKPQTDVGLGLIVAMSQDNRALIGQSYPPLTVDDIQAFVEAYGQGGGQ